MTIFGEKTMCLENQFYLNEMTYIVFCFLVWPVLFLYPEFGETDFIQEFVENQRFQDHIDVMFGDPDNRPGWDAGPDIKYTPDQVWPLTQFFSCHLSMVKKTCFLCGFMSKKLKGC